MSALPPGYDPIDITGIDRSTSPDLADAAADLNAWVQYLRYPETHDGPRLYWDQYSDERVLESENDQGDDVWYEVRSAFDGYADDPDRFFNSARAVSGVRESTVEQTYRHLVHGCLTWQEDTDVTVGADQRVEARYPEIHPARLNWMAMREGWRGHGALEAHEYEGDFIAYQTKVENGVYLVAESLARYRAIFKQAEEQMTEIIRSFTDIIANHSWGVAPDSGHDLDWKTILIGGIATGAATLLTGGTATAALTAVVIGGFADAVLTAEQDTDETADRQLADQMFIADVARDFIGQVEWLENDVSHAIEHLWRKLRDDMAALRESMEYTRWPDDAPKTATGAVPFYKNYFG